jgi:hypothetical protein
VFAIVGWKLTVNDCRYCSSIALVLLSTSPLELAMENPMLDDIKEMLQSFIAPQLEGIRGDLRALDSKIDANEA